MKCSNRRIFFCYRLINYKKLDTHIREYFIVQSILDDPTSGFENDQLVKLELELYLEDLKYELNHFLTYFFQFGSDLKWVHSSQLLKLNIGFN